MMSDQREQVDGVQVDQSEAFAADRSRLLGIATRVLGDRAEAEDVVQQAWLRLLTLNKIILKI